MMEHRIGPYQIISKLGEGGMGEVYRARDERLDRDVALKILPVSVADDPDRLIRFEREAKTLAALNHPHIAQLYGVEDAALASGRTTRALVMELVDGDDLAARITRGRLPIEEALSIARQIALALEAAHEAGIVHRDLKPANIKLRPDGTVKVLDFGLARVTEAAQAGPGTDQSLNSPTRTSPAVTAAGFILGTAAYMAPEQAKGAPVDKRADIWSFGVVLFEMLTGRNPFAGATVSEMLAAVIKDEPTLAELPFDTPAAVRRVLRRCLAKNPAQRVRDIADARLEIEQALSEEADQIAIAQAVSAPGSLRSRVMWAALAAAAGALLAVSAMTLIPGDVTPAPIARVSLSTPAAAALSVSADAPSLTLSHDGGFVVYQSMRTDPEGVRLTATQLVMRRLEAFEATPLANIGLYPVSPFVSPDNAWIAMQTTRDASIRPVLARMPVAGGPLTVVCDLAPLGWLRGGSFTDDGQIVFATNQLGGGLYSVAAAGGEPALLTRADASRGERDHLWPHALPAGAGILFTIARDDGTFDVAVRPREAESWRVLVRGASSPRYLPSGHLVYASSGALSAVRFDLPTLNVTSDSVTLVDGVMTKPNGAADFAISGNGTLAYVAGGPLHTRYRLVWVARDGTVEPLPLDPGLFVGARLAPDGRRAAITVEEAARAGVWVYDFARRTFTRVSGAGEFARDPVWSPDGRRLAYFSKSEHGIFTIPVEGFGEPTRLTDAGEREHYPNAWTPDGTRLVFLQSAPLDLFVVSTSPPHDITQLTTAAGPDVEAAVSPDGRWLAHVSFDGREPEIVVGPVAATDRRLVVGRGGRYPAWSPDGRELLFVDEAGLRRVEIDPAKGTALSPPTVVLPLNQRVGVRHINPAPDGRRFLMLERMEMDGGPSEIRAVLNWIADVRSKLP